MLRTFRERGKGSQEFIIGSHRKPEAVVMSYERYIDMVDRLADQEMRQVAETRLAAGGASEAVDLNEIARSVGVDPERTRI